MSETAIQEKLIEYADNETFYDFAVLETYNGKFDAFIGQHAEMCTKYSRGFEVREDIPELRYFGTIIDLKKMDDKQYQVVLLFETGFKLPFNVNVNWQFICEKGAVAPPA